MAVLALAACGGSSMSSDDVAAKLRAGLNEQGAADKISATAVDCVKKNGNEYSCVVTLVDNDAKSMKAGFSVTCETADKCIWQHTG